MHFARISTRPPPPPRVAAPLWTPCSSTLVGDSELVVFPSSFEEKVKTISDSDCSWTLYEANIGYMWIKYGRETELQLVRWLLTPRITPLQEPSRIYRWGGSFRSQDFDRCCLDDQAWYYGGHYHFHPPDSVDCCLEEEGDLAVMKSLFVRGWGTNVEELR